MTILRLVPVGHVHRYKVIRSSGEIVFATVEPDGWPRLRVTIYASGMQWPEFGAIAKQVRQAHENRHPMAVPAQWARSRLAPARDVPSWLRA